MDRIGGPRALVVSALRERFDEVREALEHVPATAWSVTWLDYPPTDSKNEIWRTIAASSCDVLLVALPEEQGLVVVRELVAGGDSRPIILIPPTDSEVTRLAALSAGALDCLGADRLRSSALTVALTHALTHRRLEEIITYRGDYAQLISVISAHLSDVVDGQSTRGITEVLPLLGRFARCDRSMLVLFDRETDRLVSISEWVHDGEAPPDDVAVSTALERSSRWLLEATAGGTPLEIFRRGDLPPEAATFDAFLEHHAIESLLAMPFAAGASLRGLIVVAGLQVGPDRHTEVRSLLRTVAEAVGNVLRRRRDQEAVIASEHRFRSLLEGLNEGVLQCDRDDVILHINPKACELLGYEPAELIGERLEEILVWPDDIPELHTRNARRLTGISETYELRLRRRDGSFFWAEMNATPLRAPDGAIIGSLGGFIDITARLAEREALRESEERLRHYFQNSLIGVAIIDRDHRWLELNDYMCHLHGYSRAELSDLTGADLTHPDDVAHDVAQFERLCAGEFDHYELDKRFIHKRGHTWYARLSVEAVRHTDRSLNYAIILAQDITAQKTAQRALVNQSGFLRQLIDSNPNLIFALDSSGRFTLANRAFADLYGLTVEEIIGKTNADIVDDPEQRRTYDDDNRMILETGKSVVINQDRVFDTRTGRERWFQAAKSRLVGPDGKAAFVLCTASEITERKRAEDESVRLQHQLMQSHKMEAIGQLAAGVAHDLNNALAAVVGHLQLLVSEEPLSPTGARSLNTALLGCERASALISQLLGFSRQGKYNLRTLSLRQIAETTLEFIAKVLDKDITIELGEEPQETLVRGDAGQLQQVLTNLIINARQAIRGEGRITLRFGRREVLNPERFNPNAPTGFYATVSITDTGVGIAPDEIDKIFEPFFTTKGEKEGSGLGLSMVYGIMQNHAGWVEVDSTPGMGSTFTLYLPVATGNERAEERPSREVTRTTQGRGRILVIDDEAVLVDLAKQFLALAGFEVTGFTDPQQALEWYRGSAATVDLIVLDMKMPRLDGAAAFRRIREIWPDAKIVIMSGYSHDTAAQELLDAGALRFFEKPLRYPELVEWVLRYLGTEASSRSAPPEPHTSGMGTGAPAVHAVAKGS